ncbi:MAG: MATE family efflux transporter [Desulfobacterales bacterium]|nr:MATE family efflux transporter [Desulfobacterales bacterium]
MRNKEEIENRQPSHPFTEAPHRTLFAMSLPLLLSLIAEPLTGLADTAFIARLGAIPLAAVGIGTTALTSMFWIFNFLSVGTQTEIAAASGAGDNHQVNRIASMALMMSLGLGIVVAGITFPLAPAVVSLMGADQTLHDAAVSYFRIRLIGAPAILITFAAFGIFRGLQDMKTQFRIAVSINLINIILDPLLIFGPGPFPAMGVSGAALASAAAQWAGAIWSVLTIRSDIMLSRKIKVSDGLRLVRIGRDLFIRTGMLTAFLMLTTRTATLIGPDAGAAHQALRQFWLFTALFLDAYAVAGQSIIAYFTGMGHTQHIRRAAKIVCIWSVVIGTVLMLVMIVGQGFVEYLLVPEAALAVFGPAWLVTALFQPLNALAFGTDGIHWGTGDFQYLRNAMMLASLAGITGLWMLDPDTGNALTRVWIITGVWIGLRSFFGIIRIWPGFGRNTFSVDGANR